MKKTVFLAIFLSLFFKAQANQPIPFGFSKEQILKETANAEQIITAAQYKRRAIIAGLLTGAGFYLYRTYYKFMEWAPPGTVVLFQTNAEGQAIGVVGRLNPPSNMSWADTFLNLARSTGEMVGEFAAGYLVRFYADEFVGNYVGPFDNIWFLNKNTDIVNLRESLSEDILLLPTVSKKEIIDQRIEIIKNKLEMLVADLMKFFGYLDYRRQQELENSIFLSVKMEYTIKSLQDNTEAFCNDFNLLLDDYVQGSSDFKKYAEKGSKLEAALTFYLDTVYADIKTFDLYEHKKAKKSDQN